MKWFLILLAVLVLGCPITLEVPMAETADIAVIDGEDAGADPWEWDSITEQAGNDLSLDASAKNNGSYGYKYSWGGTNEILVGNKSLAGNDFCYAREYFYLPSGNYPYVGSALTRTAYWSRIEAPAGAILVGVRVGMSSTGAAITTINYRDTAARTIVTAKILTTDTWHYVDYYYKVHATEGAIAVWVDGIGLGSAGDLDTSGNTIDEFKCGINYSTVNPANGEYLYIDDVLLSTTGPIGEYDLGILPQEPGQGVCPPWLRY